MLVASPGDVAAGAVVRAWSAPARCGVGHTGQPVACSADNSASM